MKHFVDIATDQNGNGIQGASVSVYVDSGHTVLATLYSDDGVTQKTNPVTTAANGWFDFFIADGHYWFVISASGYPTVYLNDVVIQDSPTNNIVIGAQAPRQVSGGPERLSFQSPTVNQCCIATFVTTDTTQNARLLVDMQGNLEWGGPNQTDQDVLLGWSAVGRLSLSGASGGGLNIVRWTSPGVLEAQPRITLNNDGSGIGLSDGTNPADCWIERSGPSALALQPSGGKVGIGTPSPRTALDVNGIAYVGGVVNTNPLCNLVVNGSAGIIDANTTGLYFGPNSGGVNVIISSYYSGGTICPLAFMVGSTEVMRLTTDYKLGIGTTSPHSKLAVAGLPVYANNAAAIAGGLAAGDFYRDGGDPDHVCVVH